MKKINSPDWMTKITGKIEKQDGIVLKIESFESEKNGLTFEENYKKNNDNYTNLGHKTTQEKTMLRELKVLEYWSSINNALRNYDKT